MKIYALIETTEIINDARTFQTKILCVSKNPKIIEKEFYNEEKKLKNFFEESRNVVPSVISTHAVIENIYNKIYKSEREKFTLNINIFDLEAQKHNNTFNIGDYCKIKDDYYTLGTPEKDKFDLLRINYINKTKVDLISCGTKDNSKIGFIISNIPITNIEKVNLT